MLSRVSMLCFAASYGVALIVELLRASGKVRWSALWVWIWMLAGLLAHTSYLVLQAREGMAVRGAPLSSWYHWCLIGAWALALVGLLLSFSRPKSSVGLFLLPLVLGLIGLARAFPKNRLFNDSDALRAWGMLHGIGLLVGVVCVLIGFAMGLMYLLQSRRLKRKIPIGQGLKLPPLEWLGRANERSLLWSAFWLTMGLLAGIVMNLVRRGQSTGESVIDGVAWSDPTVLTSGLLFVWLIGVTTFSLIYKPARMGRKVAYLTLANFIILALVLGMVLFGPSDHADGSTAKSSSQSVTALPWIRPVRSGQGNESGCSRTLNRTRSLVHYFLPPISHEQSWTKLGATKIKSTASRAGEGKREEDLPTHSTLRSQRKPIRPRGSSS